jgi:hypothetical protein
VVLVRVDRVVAALVRSKGRTAASIGHDRDPWCISRGNRHRRVHFTKRNEPKTPLRSGGAIL